MPNHDGRTALVTGAGRGLGQAFALRFADEHAAVAIVDLHSPDETEAVLRSSEAEVASFVCDVSDPESVTELAEAVRRELGRVDILVNNVGIYPYQSWADITFEDWRRVHRVNLDSVYLMSRAFVPAMQEAGWGRVINLATGAAWTPSGQMAHYISSKMAVIGFTRALATEVGSSGVTVNAVAPSLIKTPGAVESTKTSYGDDIFELVAKSQPIDRVQTPDDLVGVVSFLASEDARFVTGQTLSVDGGRVRL